MCCRRRTRRPHFRVDQAKIVEWVLKRDWFTADHLTEAFNGHASSTFTDMLTQLAEMGVIEHVE